MHRTELELKTLSVKSKDAVYVSDFYKQHEKNIQPHIIRNKTKPKVDGGVSKKQQAMLDDIYQLWLKYSSLKKGKVIGDEVGDEDKRDRRYTNEECYNFIRANYPKLDNSTIEEYIRKYNK